MDVRSSLRAVLVHDWLTGMRGGEKCLEVLCRRWPDAPIFTLLHQKGSVSSTIENHRPTASFIRLFPGVERYYRSLLPLMPMAANWRIPVCDLLVSFSHCVAKAAQPPQGVPHVCYCFTPMRYVWHMREAYFGSRFRGLTAIAIDRMLDWIQKWDRRTAERVTHFVAISRTVRDRIAECYSRESIVIYPPVDTEFYTPSDERRADYYLVVSAFAPYKRIDLAIEACRRLGRKLVVIGTGQDDARLRVLAGPDVTFLGWQPDSAIRDQLRRCRALLFPGEEDFGIVPVEANACGTPVIALGKGGATESILPLGNAYDPTGVWFPEQNADSLIEAIERFEQNETIFDADAIRLNSLRFNRERYEAELVGYLEHVAGKASPNRQRTPLILGQVPQLGDAAIAA